MKQINKKIIKYVQFVHQNMQIWKKSERITAWLGVKIVCYLWSGNKN